MNLEVLAQLTVLTLIIISGPLVIALLAVRKGNL
uniref:Photosystem II reaction center protein Psb30 n=8 Tax=Cycadales TaxID=3297 RepID=A0A0A6Z6D4_CERHI|nr:photosystem II reaction center protein ycf12 [Bowenia serrulata]YP_009113672.1 photosystem II reaction center protein ycf12 [Ceratozamia hildae]YP_009113711.1 photosystem II reaction center protein ycf12 [Zamia furfuracea]YP_009113868.1 photosystem II reaction center protein ycf12 [Stangeria eriopus]YP_009158326.1 photosystem II reaction center protein ycf12 [Macrozamia mountperriensis]YP_009158413.1 photosystem II reaction center protein ycf12 [Dioon spinulosum]YP_009158587.1 photosystem 